MSAVIAELNSLPPEAGEESEARFHHPSFQPLSGIIYTRQQVQLMLGQH